MRTITVVSIASAAAMACADNPSAPAVIPDGKGPPTVQSDPLTPEREVVLNLTGRAVTTEWRVDSPAGLETTITTVIEVATHELVTGEPVDTMLAINIAGVPHAGDLLIAPPSSITIKDVAPGIPIIFLGDAGGRVELMIFTRYDGFPAREFLQAEPTAMRVTSYDAPDPSSRNGRLVGQIDFLAEEYYREYAIDGSATIRKRDGRTRVRASFQAQVEHRIRNVNPVP